MEHKNKQQNNGSGYRIKQAMRRLVCSALPAWLVLVSLLIGAFGPGLDAIETGNWSQAAIAKNQNTEEPSDATKKFGEIASFVVSVFTPIIGIEASLIGVLMDNEFVIGEGGIMEGDESVNSITDIGVLLNYLWQVVRDLVNYAFIVVLIIIAFMIVISAGGGVGGGDSGIQAGKILPKFVIAVVLVNFTWFGAKVVLDVATVATHIVYSIPMSIPGHEDMLGKHCKKSSEYTAEQLNTAEAQSKLCLRPISAKILDADADLTDSENTASKGYQFGKNNEIIYRTGMFTIHYLDFDQWEDFSHNNIASILAYSILHIQTLPMTNGNEDTFMKLTIRSVSALLLMIIILAVFSIMFFILLERIIIIWVNIVMAPIAVLIWLMKDVFSSANLEGSKILGLNAFIGSAFLPAFMGVPLVFGIIMVIVGRSANVTIPEGVGFPIDGLDFVISGVENIYQFFWYAIAIGVMWTAARIADDRAQFTKGAISGIRGGVEGAGKFVSKLPLYAPFIPVYNAKKDGPQGAAIVDLQRVVGKARSWLDNTSYDRTNELFGFGRFPPEAMNALNRLADTKREANNFLDALQRGNGYNTALSHITDSNIQAALRNLNNDQRAEAAEILARKMDRSNPEQFRGHVNNGGGARHFNVNLGGVTITEGDKGDARQVLNTIKNMNGFNLNAAKTADDREKEAFHEALRQQQNISFSLDEMLQEWDTFS